MLRQKIMAPIAKGPSSKPLAALIATMSIMKVKKNNLTTSSVSVKLCTALDHACLSSVVGAAVADMRSCRLCSCLPFSPASGGGRPIVGQQRFQFELQSL